MMAMIVAVVLSGLVLLYGMRFAPHLPPGKETAPVPEGASA